MMKLVQVMWIWWLVIVAPVATIVVSLARLARPKPFALPHARSVNRRGIHQAASSSLRTTNNDLD